MIHYKINRIALMYQALNLKATWVKPPITITFNEYREYEKLVVAALKAEQELSNNAFDFEIIDEDANPTEKLRPKFQELVDNCNIVTDISNQQITTTHSGTELKNVATSLLPFDIQYLTTPKGYDKALNITQYVNRGVRYEELGK